MDARETAPPERAAGGPERLVVRLRRHAVVLVGPGVALVLLAGLAGSVAARTPSAPGRLVVAVLALVLAVRFVLLPFARWRGSSCLLTDRRVAVTRGVVHRDRRDVLLDEIQEIAVSQRVWHRVVGAGTVRVLVAGDEPLVLRDVPAVRRVERSLLDGVAAAQAGPGSPGHGDHGG